MNKEQILAAVREGMQKGVITDADLRGAAASSNLGGASEAAAPAASSRNSLVSRVLYALGGIIALIGVVVLVSDNWQELGIVGRLLVTLGFSLVTYIAAMVLHQKRIQNTMAQVFMLLSAVVSPIAAYTLLDSLGVTDPFEVTNQVGIACVIFVIYVVALFVTRFNILHIISGMAFSWAYYAIVAWMIKGSGFGPDILRDIAVYTSMILGFGFLAYSSWLKQMLKQKFSIELRKVSSLYNAAAFILVLFPALFLVGIWDLLYAFLVLGAIMVSINLRTTSGLILSAIALGGYIIHMSSKYFADSIGWAVTLVVIGFLVIGLGYLTYYLNRKYIAKV